GKLLLGRVPVAPNPLMEVLGERLGEAIGQRLDHDCAVVVELALEACRELVGAVDGDRECPDMVAFRRDEIGETAVRPGVAVRRLLAQEREACSLLERNVVALGARGPVPVYATCLERTVAEDLLQQLLRIVEELARRRLREDRRVLPLQLPSME